MSTVRGRLGTSFVLTAAVRLLTSALVIVIPIYAIDSLGSTPSEAGVFILLLWVGNALGVSAAAVALRNQTNSAAFGFSLVILSMLGLTLGDSGLAPFFMLAAGSGVGLPQPFLSAFMHADSPSDRPFAGLGYYSTALGTGLILGPLVAFGAYNISGFAGAFAALAVICAAGIGAAALGRRIDTGRPRPPMPSLGRWAGALRNRGYSRAVAVNLTYSLLLPVFLSYGAVLAEERFGFTPQWALLLYTGVFALSVVLRLGAVRFEAELGRLAVLSAALLLVSTLIVGIADSWPVFVLGMLLFSLPHAYIFPIANFHALRASPDDVMNASYLFQASSAIGEFVSPAAAVLLIPLVGVQGLFLVGVILASGTLLGTLYRRGPNEGAR